MQLAPEEGLSLDLKDEQLITEAIEADLPGVGNEKTLARYEGHLEHFSKFLSSGGRTFYTARRKDVSMFMNHLSKPGGAKPHRLRRDCDWCVEHGYPDGRKGSGWSASYRKSFLSAIRFLYKHFFLDDELPDINPSAHIASPKIVLERGFTPTREEVKRFLDVRGKHRDRLLAWWMFFSAGRRQTFSDARWRDFDFDAAVPTWRFVGKNDEVDVVPLHPLLVREFRQYRAWQEREAEKNPAIRSALDHSDTAFVLLTRTGRQVHPNTIGKMIAWRAIRAGVGVKDAPGKRDAPGGLTSRLSPHSLRRAWAEFAYDDGAPLGDIQVALNHKDISTTRRHYVPGKPERAQAVMLGMRL